MSFEDDSYKKALEQVQYINEAEIGFTKVAALSGGELARKAVQQNNLIIQQLINISSQLAELKAEIRVLKTSNAPAGISEDLVKRLEQLTIGEKVKPIQKGTFYAFKDPYVILEEEKAKLKK